METTVSAEDVNLIKDVAKVLREGGVLASELRLSIRSVMPSMQAETAGELLAFFQTSPLNEKDEHALLDTERDSSAGRTADFK